jgi:hypothetical protein
MDLPEEEVRARYPESFRTIWREARRFHEEGRRDFFRKRTNMPMGEYLDRGGYSQESGTATSSCCAARCGRCPPN